jgi:hypothetical protein
MNESAEVLESCPPWRAAAASARGVGHEKSGQPCQDAAAYRLLGGGWAVVAVADGLGSAALADVGARTAVNQAVQVLAHHVQAHRARERPILDEAGWRAILEDVLRASRDAVAREAQARATPVRELATTLLVLLLGPTVTAAVQVGDGAIVVRTENGDVEALTRPRREEISDDPLQEPDPINVVDPLTTEDPVAVAQVAFQAAPVRAAAVLTDGLQMLTFEYPSWKPFVPFFRPVFDYFESQQDPEAAQSALVNMLTSQSVRGRTDDDATLVVAARLPAGPLELKEAQ